MIRPDRKRSEAWSSGFFLASALLGNASPIVTAAFIVVGLIDLALALRSWWRDA